MSTRLSFATNAACSDTAGGGGGGSGGEAFAVVVVCGLDAIFLFLYSCRGTAAAAAMCAATPPEIRAARTEGDMRELGRRELARRQTLLRHLPICARSCSFNVRWR